MNKTAALILLLVGGLATTAWAHDDEGKEDARKRGAAWLKGEQVDTQIAQVRVQLAKAQKRSTELTAAETALEVMARALRKSDPANTERLQPMESELKDVRTELGRTRTETLAIVALLSTLQEKRAGDLQTVRIAAADTRRQIYGLMRLFPAGVQHLGHMHSLSEMASRSDALHQRLLPGIVQSSTSLAAIRSELDSLHHEFVHVRDTAHPDITKGTHWVVKHDPSPNPDPFARPDRVLWLRSREKSAATGEFKLERSVDPRGQPKALDALRKARDLLLQAGEVEQAAQLGVRIANLKAAQHQPKVSRDSLLQSLHAEVKGLRADIAELKTLLKQEK